MKKTTQPDPNELITRAILKEELKEELDCHTKQILEYIDLRLEPMNEMQQEINHMKKTLNGITKTLDWLVGAFKKFDEEHTVLSGRYVDVRETMDNHEVRITYLEDKKAITKKQGTSYKK